MDALKNALAAIEAVSKEWNTLKESHTGRSGWMFDNKLYELFGQCDDSDEFQFIAEVMSDEWQEAARIAAGYVPERWNYGKYFEHDRHHGSYFTFKEDVDDSGSLDFWANDVGLEWDVTSGEAWNFTPFEKALHACYGVTRFSTDRLIPEDYNEEELVEIADNLVKHVLPALQEMLEERKAVIAVYDDMKANQCGWLMGESA